MALSLDPASFPGDDAIDSEIKQLQDQLHRVRKQRELLQLRHALAEEQRLLEDAKHRLASSTPHTPTASYYPPPTDSASMIHDRPPRGIKRSHSDESLRIVEDHVSVANAPYSRAIKSSDDQESVSSTTSSVGSESVRSEGPGVGNGANSEASWDSSSSFIPPELHVDQYFEITTRAAFRDFKRKLANHFSRYSQDFRHEKWKVREAERHLSDDLLAQWRATERDETWSKLHDFLLRKLPRSRGIGNGDVVAMYSAAKQWVDQSVHAYHSYLLNLEVALPQLLDESDLKTKLYSTVLPEVLNKWSHMDRAVPDRYEDFLHELAAAERSLPERCELSGSKTSSLKGSKKRRI